MNTFYARRELDHRDRVVGWVQVGMSSDHESYDENVLADSSRSVCTEGFRSVFGFLPRKRKTYRITVREFDVEEITE